jgi:hypothetical protein
MLLCCLPGHAQSDETEAKWAALPADPVLRANLERLNNMGLAIIMYMTDHHRLPERLQQIAPDYLKVVPDCPLPDSSYRLTGTYPDFKVVCSTQLHPDGAGAPWVDYTGKDPVDFAAELENNPQARVHVNATRDLPLYLPLKAVQGH